MARKRLSDLLRHEVNKSTEDETEQSQPTREAEDRGEAQSLEEVTLPVDVPDQPAPDIEASAQEPQVDAEKTAPSVSKSVSKSASPADEMNPVLVEVTPGDRYTTPNPTTPIDSLPDPIRAELEATIAHLQVEHSQLQATVDQLQREHSQWQAQQSEWEANRQHFATQQAEQAATITTLQAEQTAAQRRESLLRQQVADLQAELTHSQTQVQSLKSELAAQAIAAQRALQPSPAPQPLKLEPKERSQTPPKASPVKTELETILTHPVLPVPPAQPISNIEIGWMD